MATESVNFSPASGELVLSSTRICFEPTAYGDTESTRRSIVFEVDEASKAAVKLWESELDPEKLTSAITKYGLRAKVDMAAVRFWCNRQPDLPPQTLKGKACRAMLQLRGSWSTQAACGITLVVTDLEISVEELAYPF